MSLCNLLKIERKILSWTNASCESIFFSSSFYRGSRKYWALRENYSKLIFKECNIHLLLSISLPRCVQLIRSGFGMERARHSKRIVSPSMPYWTLWLSMRGGPLREIVATAEICGKFWTTAWQTYFPWVSSVTVTVWFGEVLTACKSREKKYFLCLFSISLW